MTLHYHIQPTITGVTFRRGKLELSQVDWLVSLHQARGFPTAREMGEQMRISPRTIEGWFQGRPISRAGLIKLNAWLATPAN